MIEENKVSIDIKAINEKIEKESAFVDLLMMEMNKVIVGQKHMVERLLIGLLGQGHILLEGVPGLAKTLAINSLSKAVKGSFSRIQFTPDLMPGDVVGSEVVEEIDGKRTLKFVKGPIFTCILLADEINRTPPKTQSSLLEAMEEKQVTAAGVTHPMGKPFFVLATQNPIELEGTYPLPEAQLDRFMFSINLEYPTFAEEVEVVKSTTSDIQQKVNAIFSSDDIIAIQKLIRKIPVTKIPMKAKNHGIS